VIVYDYAPERFVSVVYQHCEQVSVVYNKPVEQIISQWLAVSEVYDNIGNQWNILTGEDIATRFLSDISNHMDRIGNAINIDGITGDIVDLLMNKKKDSKNKTTNTQLNGNNILTGKDKHRLTKNKNGRKKEKDADEETALRIKYALRQIFKLLDVAWAEGLTIKTIDDIINYKDINVIHEITGLVSNEWKKILPAINVIAVNRAIGQYNDFQ
jgi:hypothetical protein